MANTVETMDGKRGMLHAPYGTVAIPFSWHAAWGGGATIFDATWKQGFQAVLATNTPITQRQAFREGETDVGTNAGYSVQLDRKNTSALRGGFLSDKHYFVMLGLKLGLVDDTPRQIAVAGVSAAGLATMVSLYRDDLRGLGRDFFLSSMRNAEISIRKSDNSECEKYLGLAIQHPYGQGMDNGSNNGVANVANYRCARSPYILPPKESNNADPIVIQLDWLAGNDINVQHPAGVAVPANGTHVFIDVNVELIGYFSKDNAGREPADDYELNKKLSFGQMMLGKALEFKASQRAAGRV